MTRAAHPKKARRIEKARAIPAEMEAAAIDEFGPPSLLKYAMYSSGVDIAINFATEVSSRSSSFLKCRQHFPMSSRFPAFLNASTSSFSENGDVHLPLELSYVPIRYSEF